MAIASLLRYNIWCSVTPWRNWFQGICNSDLELLNSKWLYTKNRRFPNMWQNLTISYMNQKRCHCVLKKKKKKKKKPWKLQKHHSDQGLFQRFRLVFPWSSFTSIYIRLSSMYQLTLWSLLVFSSQGQIIFNIRSSFLVHPLIHCNILISTTLT